MEFCDDGDDEFSKQPQTNLGERNREFWDTSQRSFLPGATSDDVMPTNFLIMPPDIVRTELKNRSHIQ